MYLHEVFIRFTYLFCHFEINFDQYVNSTIQNSLFIPELRVMLHKWCRGSKTTHQPSEEPMLLPGEVSIALWLTFVHVQVVRSVKSKA